MSHKDDQDNHADQLNPNNDSYWESRGWDDRPDDWGDRSESGEQMPDWPLTGRKVLGPRRIAEKRALGLQFSQRQIPAKAVIGLSSPSHCIDSSKTACSFSNEHMRPNMCRQIDRQWRENKLPFSILPAHRLEDCTKLFNS